MCVRVRPNVCIDLAAGSASLFAPEVPPEERSSGTAASIPAAPKLQLQDEKAGFAQSLGLRPGRNYLWDGADGADWADWAALSSSATSAHLRVAPGASCAGSA